VLGRACHMDDRQPSHPASSSTGNTVIVLWRMFALIWFASLCSLPLPAQCIPFAEASQHVGETRCVKGKVLRVEQGTAGTTYLDFCLDYKQCTFTVVVFASNLRDVGDVRQLEGKEIEIHGSIKTYDGRAEIILQRYKQLSGDAARIPPLPKDYDVEKRGHFSAGSVHAKTTRKTAKKRQTAPIPTEQPVDPMAVED